MHLFAGAGGGILADILLGHIPIVAVEIDACARSVLLSRQRDGLLPRFPIWDDIKTFDGGEWRGSIDIVAGGFPCQDISSAGKGSGIDGHKSGLWKEMARVICEVSPRFVFVENSPLLTLRGLNRILWDLAAMGYDAEWGVLGASDCGFAHRRKRIWIVAHSDCAGLERINDLKEEAEWVQRSIAESIQARVEALRALLPSSCFQRKSDGVDNWVDRLRAIGNGQVPIVAATAWRILSQSL